MITHELFSPRARVISACLTTTVVAALINLAWGPVAVPLADVIAILSSGSSASGTLSASVVLDLRGPRVLLGALVGATLAVAGAAFQGLFRNPLADPSLLGISAGAATGAVAFIVLGRALVPVELGSTNWSIYGLPIAASLGAVLAAALLYLLGRRAGALDVATLLLSGIAINALCSALSGLLIFTSDEQELRELTFWSLGSLSRAHWSTLLPALPLLVAAMSGLFALAGAVNALALGEAAAAHLGFRVERLKGVLVLATAVAVGTAVALTGVIAFIGLIVPHAVRSLIGADNRYVFAACAGAGATLMLLADLLARSVAMPAEMPIGILTSLLGGPFFLWLMLYRRSVLAMP